MYKGQRRIVCVPFAKICEHLAAKSVPKAASTLHYTFNDVKDYLAALTAADLDQIQAETQMFAMCTCGVGEALYVPQGYVVMETTVNNQPVFGFRVPIVCTAANTVASLEALHKSYEELKKAKSLVFCMEVAIAACKSQA